MNFLSCNNYTRFVYLLLRNYFAINVVINKNKYFCPVIILNMFRTLTITRYIIVAAISYFFACASEEKFILFNSIVTEEFRKAFVNKLGLIVFLLVVLYALVELWLALITKNNRTVLKNFCQLIFDSYIKKKTNGTLTNADFRVSFLELQTGLIVRTGEKWYNVSFWTQYLKPVARYQVKHPVKQSNVVFLPHEGCAGACFTANSFILMDIPAFTATTASNYYQDCLDVLNLPKYKAEKLKEKASTYICFPVHRYNTDDIIGVISVDCLKNNVSSIFTENKLREIEETVEIFSVNFK